MSRRRPATALGQLAQIGGLAALGGGVLAGVCAYKGDQPFYRGLMALTARVTDGETGHRLAVLALRWGLYPRNVPHPSTRLQVPLWGLTFPSPVGVAAGFDKGGEAVRGLAAIGAAFVEVGSVTPRAQEGNPRPRVFRLPEDRAVINRYGFNSEGLEVVYNRLCELKTAGDVGVAGTSTLLGINLGKNKESLDASSDYSAGVARLGPLADYLVVNVSSPNTPGLRALQAGAALATLLAAVAAARDRLAPHRPPILVKLSPDLSSEELVEVVEVLLAEGTRVEGVIVSNTTTSREGLVGAARAEAGGLSGAPLAMRSTEVVGEVYRLTGGRLPIVGVGGVGSGEEAWRKVCAGASLVQVYTALVYQGPPVVARITRELDAILQDSEFSTIQEAVGSDHRPKASPQTPSAS